LALTGKIKIKIEQVDPGARLPQGRILARQYCVALMTAQAVLKLPAKIGLRRAEACAKAR